VNKDGSIRSEPRKESSIIFGQSENFGKVACLVTVLSYELFRIKREIKLEKKWLIDNERSDGGEARKEIMKKSKKFLGIFGGKPKGLPNLPLEELLVKIKKNHQDTLKELYKKKYRA